MVKPNIEIYQFSSIFFKNWQLKTLTKQSIFAIFLPKKFIVSNVQPKQNDIWP
jgi:hypothetical protein